MFEGGSREPLDEGGVVRFWERAFGKSDSGARSPDRPVKIWAAGYSNQGRLDYNDDYFSIGLAVRQTDPFNTMVDASSALYLENGFIAAVADGMGGYQGGATASRAVLKALTSAFYSGPRAGENARQFKKRIERCVNHAVTELRQTLRDRNLREAGTTLAGVALKPPDLLFSFHAGDSRVLCFSETEGLELLTVDHTPVGQALADGTMTEEEAAQQPDAFALTRSLGLQGDSRVEISQFTYSPGDTLLLMTDGMWSPCRGLDPEVIESELRLGGRPKDLVRRLVDQAVKVDGEDNTTLVLIRLEP